MKVLHLMFSISEQSAAYRLHLSLKNLGVESKVLVAYTSIVDDPDIIVFGKFSSLLNRILFFIERKLTDVIPDKNGKPPFYLNLFSLNLSKKIKKINPDIIHLHWICASFLSIKNLTKLNSSIVWTMHDSWAFTGGCNVPDTCFKYQKSCDDCPKVKGLTKSLVSRVFYLKNKYWSQLHINLISPSFWLGQKSKTSAVFNNNEVAVIRNAIDIQTFKVIDSSAFQDQLQIKNKNIILFGAVNVLSRNKGYDLLCKALHILKEKLSFTLVVFGTNDTLELDGIDIVNVGVVKNNQTLVSLYNIASVTAIPSRSENFPNVILESMSCGTPCIGFDIGGISEQISHKENGYVTKAYDCQDFSDGLEFLLQSNLDSHRMRDWISDHCSYDKVGKKHLALYHNIVKTNDL